MLPLRHIREYFVKYLNNIQRSQRMVLSMENISWEIFGDTCEYGHVRLKIFGDGCVGSKCIDIVDPLIPGPGQTIPRSVSRTCQHHLNVAREPSWLS